jgi:preprotein translocase subunit SecG
MKKFLLFILIISIFSLVNADVISLNSGGDNNLIINSGGNIEGFFSSPDEEVCSINTCAGLSYNCGVWGDGCGRSLNCGTCVSGYTCSSGTCVVSGVTPSGGGTTTTCTRDWVCSEWYPEPCPAEGIQKRVCVNKGTCTDKVGMPDDERTCIPELFLGPAEPLFDLFARIPIKYKWVEAGSPIEIDLRLINLGNTTALDVYFKYWIVDENNLLITELQETRAISEVDEFTVRLDLSSQMALGKYKFYTQITYDDDDKVAVAVDSFEVVRDKFFRFIVIFALIFFILMIIFLIILIIKRRKKKEKKEIKKKKRWWPVIFKRRRKEEKVEKVKKKKERKPFFPIFKKKKKEEKEKKEKKRFFKPKKKEETKPGLRSYQKKVRGVMERHKK